MKYSKLESLVLTIALAAVLISIIISLNNETQVAEILGQLLYLPVLFLALHYGRRHSYAAAVFAALIFLIAKTEEVGQFDFYSIEGHAVTIRATLYGLISIIGSELAVHLKYSLKKLENNNLVDNKTNLFQRGYLQNIVARLIDEHSRYKRSFTLLLMTIDWTQGKDQPKKDKALIKTANLLRNNIRMIDEAGYLENNQFCVILTSTNALAAQVVSRRINKLVTSLFEQDFYFNGVEIQLLSFPDNEAEIKAFLPIEKEKVSA